MRTWSNFLNVIQHWFSDTSAAVRVVFTGATASDGSDAGAVIPIDVPMDKKGNWPNTWTTTAWSGVAGAADDAEIYITPTDISFLNYHIIENNSAVPIEVYKTLDGTYTANQPAIAVQLSDDITAGGTPSMTIPAMKTGIIRNTYMKGLKVWQVGAGTINVGEVVGLHGVL